MERRRARLVNRETPLRNRQTPSRRYSGDETYRSGMSRRSDSRFDPYSPAGYQIPSTAYGRPLPYSYEPVDGLQDTNNSYMPLDPYASYIPPPPYFLPPVLRQSSVYGSFPPPPPASARESPYGPPRASRSFAPYGPSYYDHFHHDANSEIHEASDEVPDGVRVDFSALRDVHNVSDKTASTLMPSVDAVTLVCAKVSRVLYLRTDDLQSKAGASTHEIELTATELSGFAMVLGNVREVLETTSGLISYKAFDNINTLILYSKKALHKIQSVITTSRKIPSRLNFLKRDSLNSSLAKAKPVRLNLECLKTSLAAMMSTITLAARQDELDERRLDTSTGASSPVTVVNGNNGDRESESSKVTYELDAAVERITLKLEDDILANSRAIKRWQQVERRDFHELYVRGLANTDDNPISPASQWVSGLVPFEPVPSNMKRIAGPPLPRSIGYGSVNVSATTFEPFVDEEDEQARIAAVVQVLLAKWTEGHFNTGRIRKSDRHKSGSAKAQEDRPVNRSTPTGAPQVNGSKAFWEPHGIKTNDSRLVQKISNGKKAKRVSFEETDTGVQVDQHESTGSNDIEAQDADISKQDTLSAEIQQGNDVEGITTTTAIELTPKGVSGTSVNTSEVPKASIATDKARTHAYPGDIEDVVDDPIHDNDEDMYGGASERVPASRARPHPQSMSARWDHLSECEIRNIDDLPRTGWEEADQLGLTQDFVDPDIVRSHHTQRGDWLEPLHSSAPHISNGFDPIVPIYPRKLSSDYDQAPVERQLYLRASSGPPSPSLYRSGHVDGEEPINNAGGFAETIQSSYDDRGRSRSSRRSQSRRDRRGNRYPQRRSSFSGSEEESSPSRDDRKAQILREKSLSSVIHQLELDVKESRAALRHTQKMLERKDAELASGEDMARVKYLESQLAQSVGDLEAARRAADERAAADERNSTAKVEQIQDLEVRIAAANTKISKLETRVARRDASLERLKRELSDNGSADRRPRAHVDSKEEVVVEEVVVHEDEEPDGVRRRRKRSPSPASASANSYYSTIGSRKPAPRQDGFWEIACSMIITAVFGLGLAIGLAPYLRSDNGTALRRALAVLHEPQQRQKGFVLHGPAATF